MRKFLSILLILLLVFTFAACGNDEPAEQGGDDPVQQEQPADTDEDNEAEQNNEPAEPPADPVVPEGWLKTKTGKFYSQFGDEMYMEYEMEFEGMKMKMISATKGEKTYSETSIDGVSAGVNIIDGNDMYTIDHASKMVIKMSLQPQDPSGVVTNILEEEDLDLGELKEGTREIDGKKYDTEEWIIEGAASIMCFDGDDMAYMIGVFEGEETVMKVIETSAKVDSKLFEIPADYQMMSF